MNMNSGKTLETTIGIYGDGKYHTDKNGDQPHNIEAAQEPFTVADRDYMTLLVTTEPSNKQVRFQHGELLKNAPHPIYDAKAFALHVPDVEVMRELQLAVATASNAVLVSGFVPDAPADGFRVLSKKAIGEKTGEPYEGGWVDMDVSQARFSVENKTVFFQCLIADLIRSSKKFLGGSYE